MSLSLVKVPRKSTSAIWLFKHTGKGVGVLYAQVFLTAGSMLGWESYPRTLEKEFYTFAAICFTCGEEFHRLKIAEIVARVLDLLRRT